MLETVLQDDFAPARPEPQPVERTEADAATAESKRQTHRVEIREQIAAAQLAEKRWHEINDAIAAIEEKKEQLAAEHVDAAGPIQAELAEIEQRQIKAITTRQPTDGVLEGRRKALLEQLQKLNADLEGAIAGQDRLIANLAAERAEVGRRANVSSATRELFFTGRPDLLLALKVAESAASWATARLESAINKREKFGPSEFLEAEIAAATIEAERAKQAAEAAYKAVLDE